MRVPKGLAKQQQDAVNEIVAMHKRLALLADGPAMTPGTVGPWLHGDVFANGQLSVMFDNAMYNLKAIIGTFEDCAEDDVKVEEV